MKSKALLVGTIVIVLVAAVGGYYFYTSRSQSPASTATSTPESVVVETHTEVPSREVSVTPSSSHDVPPASIQDGSSRYKIDFSDKTESACAYASFYTLQDCTITIRAKAGSDSKTYSGKDEIVEKLGGAPIEWVNDHTVRTKYTFGDAGYSTKRESLYDIDTGIVTLVSDFNSAEGVIYSFGVPSIEYAAWIRYNSADKTSRLVIKWGPYEKGGWYPECLDKGFWECLDTQTVQYTSVISTNGAYSDSDHSSLEFKLEDGWIRLTAVDDTSGATTSFRLGTATGSVLKI